MFVKPARLRLQGYGLRFAKYYSCTQKDSWHLSEQLKYVFESIFLLVSGGKKHLLPNNNIMKSLKIYCSVEHQYKLML